MLGNFKMKFYLIIDPANAKNITKDFFILGLIGENIFDQVYPTEQDKSTLPLLCTKNENFGHSYLCYFSFIWKNPW